MARKKKVAIEEPEAAESEAVAEQAPPVEPPPPAEEPSPAEPSPAPTPAARIAAASDHGAGRNWWKLVGQLVLEAAPLALPGPRKADRVVAQVLDHLGVDDRMSGFVRAVVQAVYNEHRRAGRVS